MNRRQVLQFFLGTASLTLVGRIATPPTAWATEAFEKLLLSNDVWKKRLSLEQYHILREEGTEAPFSSPLLHEKREGVFACAGCALELFDSKFKFDSGTGWPSFFDAIPGHLETKDDHELGYGRTEYHCAKCGGHHGHVFDDGPKPTGLRYCSNGVALVFVPKST